MSVTIDGTNGITTPDLASGPVAGTTANFSGDVTLGSSVLATPTGSAPSYTCRAWVIYNASGGTISVGASGNVSSVTYSAIGVHVVNFATAMPSADYSVCGTALGGATNNQVMGLSGTPTTTSCTVRIRRSDTQTLIDFSNNSVAIFR